MDNRAATARLTRAEQQARTRAALIEAAGRVFIERGFAGSSVEAIAAEAGFTRGAFYSNFRSKEELFAELLQVRVYSLYADLARQSADRATRTSPRDTGERLAAIQANPDGRWIFRLWLELLAHAGRDDEFRRIAAGFWSGNRALAASAIATAYEEADTTPPIAPNRLASAWIAIDIGLALQHFVDPEGAPLELYPELCELLFGPLNPAPKRTTQVKATERQ
ncbi:MAG TPA: TetR/AcrR family transcriptional regulator [Gemmatimonadales bacterium]|nr:TetR/AcrR family transcriptional regulator [Gemmatimonadales bacterium]